MSQRTGIVIVVDDDAAVRNALKFALETEGLSVVLCEGGHELLGWQELPAGGCLVVDYRMPDMDGFELVSRLRERQISLPAILITSQVNADLRKRATEAGFCEVLEKPLHDSSLLDTVRVALASAAIGEGDAI
jgi:two-component system, LuxR family, response regulator FixJ